MQFISAATGQFGLSFGPDLSERHEVVPLFAKLF